MVGSRVEHVSFTFDFPSFATSKPGVTCISKVLSLAELALNWRKTEVAGMNTYTM